ncbi:DUF4427 domain-containing protein [Salmonella enterica subsp. enterica serovar Typhimurium]|nr:DUF4427 domain-containing protein [Salmonella enterica subsp. enterica serovar Typhimurium]
MITNPVVRALLQAGMIKVNKEGRYLLDVNLASVDWPLRRKRLSQVMLRDGSNIVLISKREGIPFGEKMIMMRSQVMRRR